MTCVALVAICAALFAAGAGLAAGAAGSVAGVRFGGDDERTRVVIDMGAEARGRVIESGADGRVVLTLAGVAAADGLEGRGGGLVRTYNLSTAGTASRLELQASRAVEIERRFLLPPGDGATGYRYVIDLKASSAAPLPAPTTALPRRTPPSRPRRADRPLVVIDAGHGGHDPGARGGDHAEKELTLAAALDLKAQLERSGRYRVVMTRQSDVYIGLNRRVQVARAAGADLFISLHADAGSDPTTRGASVYTLSEHGASRAVREVTRDDNWTRDLHLPGRDPSVDRILLDMTQRATQNRSAQFARVLLSHLEGADHPLLRRSHRDAGLAVLLAPDVPAVLLEMGFITNADDERALADRASRRRLVRAVAEGIDRYFTDGEGDRQIASVASADL